MHTHMHMQILAYKYLCTPSYGVLHHDMIPKLQVYCVVGIGIVFYYNSGYNYLYLYVGKWSLRYQVPVEGPFGLVRVAQEKRY